MTTRLVLFVAQSEKVENCGRLQWHKVYSKLNENLSTVQMLLQLERCVNMTELQVHPSLQTKKRRLKTGEF